MRAHRPRRRNGRQLEEFRRPANCRQVGTAVARDTPSRLAHRWNRPASGRAQSLADRTTQEGPIQLSKRPISGRILLRPGPSARPGAPSLGPPRTREPPRQRRPTPCPTPPCPAAGTTRSTSSSSPRPPPSPNSSKTTSPPTGSTSSTSPPSAVAKKFGEDAAAQLAGVVGDVDGRERLDAMADAVIECDSVAELLARLAN